MYQSPSIAWRGKLASLVAQVQQQRPAHGEHRGVLRCICGATCHFVIQSNGISRAHCSAGCPARWSH